MENQNSFRDDQERPKKKRDLYDLHVDFETKLHEWSLKIANLESTREYFRRTFRLLTREKFYKRRRGMTPKGRNYERKKLRTGFDEWLKREQKRAAEQRRRFDEFGCPPEIEQMVEQRLQEHSLLLALQDVFQPRPLFLRCHCSLNDMPHHFLIPRPARAIRKIIHRYRPQSDSITSDFHRIIVSQAQR